jgi:hypothetical protein
MEIGRNGLSLNLGRVEGSVGKGGGVGVSIQNLDDLDASPGGYL